MGFLGRVLLAMKRPTEAEKELASSLELLAACGENEDWTRSAAYETLVRTAIAVRDSAKAQRWITELDGVVGRLNDDEARAVADSLRAEINNATDLK